MAAAIGGRAAKAGHTVEVVSRDPAKARALAEKLAAGATTGTYGAAPAGDIVILAIPYPSAAAVVADFGEALDGKVIIDITNPVAPDLSGLVTPHGSSGAQETAKVAPAGAHVVKAFNTIFGHVLAKGGRLDAFIAADDAEAKARVSTFLESLGLRPLDVGGLRMAQTLEALGLMMIGLAKNGAGTWDIAMNVDIGSNRL
jgi:predicted dinucleotide-binding enzyme